MYRISLPARLEQIAVSVAILYLVLLPLNIHLRGPVCLHDLCGPIFALIVLLRRPWRDSPDYSSRFLFGFLVLGALTAACHFRSGADIFEFAIFAYMAVLFWFFRGTLLPRRWLFRIGLGTLAAMLAYMFLESLSGIRSVYQVYEGSSLGFMARRFFFSFEHPNLAASFYFLPVVCLLTAWRGKGAGYSPVQWIAAAGVMAVLCLPLGLTVSRHMLLILAVLLGYVCSEVSDPHTRPSLSVIAAVCLAGCFTLFYLTILFPFFPLRSHWPFFNTSTYGMYITHQVIYLKIVFRDAANFFFGVGKTGVRELYPALADWDTIYAVLQQYRQEFLTASFVTYMDAHNEFLNLAADFGVPAMICAYAAILSLPFSVDRRSSWRVMLGFAVAGLLLVSFWDDILSKRWIWVALGILAQPSRSSGNDAPRPHVVR